MSDDTSDIMDTVQYFDNGRSVYLSRTGEPMTLRQWSQAFGDATARTVARTTVGDAEVVTMWMGIDHNPISDEEPLIFGSVIQSGSSFGDEIESATEDDALKAHATLVERLRHSVEEAP